MLKACVLLGILFLSELGVCAKLKCFQLRYKLSKQQCAPKKGFKGKLVPCYNLCTKELVKVEDCNKSSENKHCCIHDSKCVMKGTGYVPIPPEYKLPKPAMKITSWMDSQVQKGCTPKTRTQTSPTKRTNPFDNLKPLRRRNPMTNKPKPESEFRRNRASQAMKRRPTISTTSTFITPTTSIEPTASTTTITTTPCKVTKKPPRMVVKFATKMNSIFNRMGMRWEMGFGTPCADE